MATESPIVAQGTLTVGDMAKFQYFHLHRRLWWTAPLMVGWIVFLGLSILGTMFSPRDASISLLAALSPILVWVLLILAWSYVMGVSPYVTARKQLRQQPGLFGPKVFAFTSDGFRSSGPNASSEQSWANITEVCETKSLFLLYLAPNLAVPVPKRYFAETDLPLFRQTIPASLKRKLSRLLAFVARWC